MRKEMLLTLTALLLCLALATSAEAGRCSNRSLAGAWGYTETGMVVAPGPTQVVATAVGRYDFDSEGNFAGRQISSAGGTVSEDAKLGTYVVYPNCTGTLTLQIYDPSGTTLRRNSVWYFVLDDESTELRGIMVSMTMPNGVAIGPIMSLSATRLSRGASDGE